ncbi:3-isopropylmalate dehydratase small subunit [Patulibacter medicamentivorans]|uniref:3-isopropylmalate dehydratase small subunit n=1 Tax=Patulibacter medicamentivorans TaxID=1097667 RepID=H0E244_9ACTN|nr:3-isopropylmalate dehydratase small subunit [Patulibacter medicamentivorans]EHN12254.1 3-isopropylmalate dehydratase small subunit [Patulibacter medicamentivorans]
MDPVKIIEGKVSDLHRDDVDTDQIIPARFMKRVERTGFGEYLFHDAKQAPDWNVEIGNPILTAGANFGSGSSREHAPWALEDAGFKAIVATSLADIFYSNSTKIGLLPVELPEDQVRRIAAAGQARIDLEAQTVEAGGESFPFEIDPETKHRLLNGLDDISLTLAEGDKIDAYEARQAQRAWSGPSSLDLPAEDPIATTPVA